MATLCKRGHLNKGWKQRLFLLDSNGSLTYFRKNKEAGVIPGDNVKRWIGPAERARAKENDRLQTVRHIFRTASSHTHTHVPRCRVL